MCAKTTMHLCLLCLLVCAQQTLQDSEALHEHDHHHDDHEVPCNATEPHALCHDDHHGHGHRAGLTYSVWLAALLAISIISACGIFGVLVIPIMQKVFYQHLIQFLVALAVGTLTGDALLHLFPHALMHDVHHLLSEEEGYKYHQRAVWYGFAALSALFLFFIFEKMVSIFGKWREHRAQMHSEKKVRIVRSGHKPSDNVVGEHICKHKYSGYCVADIDLATAPAATSTATAVASPEQSALLPSGDACSVITVEKEVTKSTIDNTGKVVITSSNGHLSMASNQDTTYETVYIREHEHSHHGHSHAHSHLHSKPESISSVAWMVIFGDGIHNLADGMAIGVAFSESYMSGISTSIAVLCHELPHEIGDFAMLLKAGMSVKQALCYNILSSVLAVIGMVGGLLLGSNDSWSSWVFCATAGIFLYVGLVDMIPELNSGHAHPYTSDAQTDSHAIEVFLQLLGMALGAFIMLLIALYEHDMKAAFV